MSQSKRTNRWYNKEIDTHVKPSPLQQKGLGSLDGRAAWMRECASRIALDQIGTVWRIVGRERSCNGAAAPSKPKATFSFESAPMFTLSVLFPWNQRARFDVEHLEKVHLPLARELWGPLGLTAVDLFLGVDTPDGKPPAFLAIGMLHFIKFEHLIRALAGDEAASLRDDIANFTNVKPLFQLTRRNTDS